MKQRIEVDDMSLDEEIGYALVTARCKAAERENATYRTLLARLIAWSQACDEEKYAECYPWDDFDFLVKDVHSALSFPDREVKG